VPWRLSSWQKLASPTFHVPFSSTAVPVWLLRRVVPPGPVRSYLTVACVLEVSVTDVTLAERPDASGLLDSAVIAEENLEPFCSRATRSEVGVDELKNFSQLAVIWATAVPVPVAGVPAEALPLPLVAAPAPVADAAEVAGAVGADGEEELLEEHAVTASAATMAPAIARPFA
jgi:hypothetical protein